jgi:predicted enzyme related to lactoylglutathione lyase
MGERTSYPPGTFCWVDLQTGDQDGAKTFYSELLGWRYEDIPIGEGMVYSMAKLQDQSVAAMGPLQGPEMPAHWNCYVTVESADAGADRARELGATLLAEPFDVFDAGRMAAFQDPQGAVLSIWEPKDTIGAGLVNVPGALTWNDLLTPDVEASAAFYRELFGWDISALEGADGQYWAIANNGRGNGGLMPMPEGGHPAWNLYFLVEDADAAVARARELGGDLVMGPTDVPNGTRFAVLRDPGNAVFSIAAGPVDDD